jgi:hypothetical protein
MITARRSKESTMAFVVAEDHELHALLKTLLEAKFNPDPQNPEVSASPVVAELCRRAVAAVVEAERAAGRIDRAGRTIAWFRDVRGHSALEVVRRRIDETATLAVWKEWTNERRRDFIRMLLSPFEADEEIVNELLEAATRAN